MSRTLLPLAAIAALAIPSTADAGVLTDSQATMAAGACQSALPVFDGVIRKRPLAVQNEGDSTSFVTCGLDGKLFPAEETSTVAIALTNVSDAEVLVNCTLVDGRSGFADPVYLPRSLAIAGGTTLATINWTAEDNGGVNFVYPAISCSLPPGAGIAAVGREFVPVAP